MTLEELKNAEREAYNHWMYYEAAERGYDSAAASAACRDYLAAKQARQQREEADEVLRECRKQSEPLAQAVDLIAGIRKD